jgi:thiosulfate reductase cytochrome b subunit
VVETILIPYKALFGLVGAVITIYALYNSYHILRNFRDDENVALSMFFLNDGAADSFRMLAYISILYSLMTLLVVTGIVPDTYPYDLAVITLFLGLAYFLREIKAVTSGAGD